MTHSLSSDLLIRCLDDNAAAIPLRIEQQLRALLPGRAFVATDSLELEEYAALGHAAIRLLPEPCPSFTIGWGGPDDDQLQESYQQALWEVQWGERSLEVLQASWASDCGSRRQAWVLAEQAEVAREFILDVARQTNDPGSAVLVFRDGYWRRSAEMFAVVQETQMGELILPAGRRDEMIADFRRFLGAQAQYERLGLPWRRGAILIGPPGNGKTHFLRALVHELEAPCLYVQSLEHPYYTAEQTLESVFHRARQLRPCVLIFEDLDSLIDDDNRSFFLNQLDGFERNVGMIIVATTNHAERIDAAILDRPSRFDRKYEFSLPGAAERTRFLELWRAKVAEFVAWDGAEIPELAVATEGFSFAYLKELIVSSLLQWLDRPPGTNGEPDFAAIMREQTQALQGQRTSARPARQDGWLPTWFARRDAHASPQD